MNVSEGQAKSLVLLAVIVCLAVVTYQGKAFDARRSAAIALLGSALLFIAGFAPQIAAVLALLMIADALLLSRKGTGLIAAVGNIAAPGASTTVKVPAPKAGKKATHPWGWIPYKKPPKGGFSLVTPSGQPIRIQQ